MEPNVLIALGKIFVQEGIPFYVGPTIGLQYAWW